MKQVIKYVVLVAICGYALFYFYMNIGPGKYTTVSTQNEQLEAIAKKTLKGKRNVYIMSKVPPVEDFDEIIYFLIDKDPFTGSNIQAYEYSWTEKDGYYDIKYRFTYGSGKAALILADMKLNTLAKDVEDLSTYEQVKAVHDYLCLKCEYTGGFASVYDAVFNGKTICVGYAASFYRIMTKLGVPVKYEVGVNHAWNQVYVDGYWYNIDVTWDDIGGSGVSYEHFLKCDADFVHDSRGADAPVSHEVTGRSASENFKLFRDKSSLMYSGPIYLGIALVLIAWAYIANLRYQSKKRKKAIEELREKEAMEAARRANLKLNEEREFFS